MLQVIDGSVQVDDGKTHLLLDLIAEIQIKAIKICEF